ncbi:glycosyltransferase [Nocardia heshunensis]
MRAFAPTDATGAPEVPRSGVDSEETRNPLVRNGILLTLGSGLSALVGLGYWTVAARWYSPEAVGSNAAALSLILLIAMAARLNLNSAMVRFIPAAGARTGRLVAWAYLVCVAVSVVAGVACVAAIGLFAPGVTYLESGAAQALFVVAVTAYTLFVLQDGVLTALRRAPLVLAEAVLFSIAKLLLVVVLASALPVHGILVSWMAAVGGAVVIVGTFLFTRAIPARQHDNTDTDRLPPVRDIARFVAADYVGSVFSIAAVTAMPLLVVALLGAAQNAFYSIAWAIANALHLLNLNMGTSLVVETATDQTRLAAHARRVLTRTATLLVPAVLAVTLLAPYLLGVFGDGYRAGSTPLRLLALAALPHLLVSTATSSARAQRKLRLLLAIQSATCVSALGLGALLLPELGLYGAAIAWLATQLWLAAVLLVRRDLWMPDESHRRWWWHLEGTVARLALTTRLRVLLRPALPRLRALVAADPPGDDPALQAMVRERPGTHARILPTVTDIRVAVLSPDGGDPTAVLKFARTPLAGHDLETQARVLAELADMTELGDWRTLLPRIEELRTDGDTVVSVESFVPERDLATVLLRHPDRYRPLIARALTAISELHTRTGSFDHVGEGELAEWVDRPLRQLAHACATMSPRSTATVDRLGTVLRAALSRRRVLIGWTHGDFHPGNVRLGGSDDAVTGLIDWGGAGFGRLTALDGCLLLLTANRLLEDRELGDIVRERLLHTGGLTPDERTLLDDAWGTAQAGPSDGWLDERVLILLTWLHHVVGLWTKCDAYRERPIWWAVNVEPVLRAFETVATALEQQARISAELRGDTPSDLDDPDSTLELYLAGPPPTVDVVICAYTERRWQDLVDAVASVRRQTYPVRRLVVVIDHCPGLLERARYELPGTTVVPNRETKGLSGARNTGIAATTADIVTFLDDDAVAAPDWIAALLTPYADPAVLGVGGQVRPNWRAARPRWFPDEFGWVVGSGYRGLPTRRAPVRNVIGANMSMRRELLVESGGFDEQLGRVARRPLGCEETELCIRVRRAHPGGVHVYEPAAIVHHTVPGDRATWSYFRSRCLAEGQSKAVVRRLAGAADGLSSERTYVTSTIPRGVLYQLGRVARGQLSGLAAACALIAGVMLTALGFMAGTIRPAYAPDRRPLHRYLLRRSVFAALPVALALWLLALRHVDTGRIGDYGLIPLLPVTYWAALAILLTGFAVLVHNPRTPSALLAAHIGVLIAFLHATPCLVYGTLRYSWAWKHVGVVDYFLRHDGTDPSIHELSAYQYWPGFFNLNALLVRASGLHSALGYATWAPPVFNALLIGPLVLIFRAATDDRRLIWTAVAIYVLGAWVGQDYFAPQAVDYFLYLSLIALCLHYFQRRSAVRTGRRVAFGVLALLPIAAAIIVTHQLTPVMVVAALVALALLCRYRLVTITVLTVALAAVWDLVFAGRWIRENFDSIRSTIGLLGHNANSGFISLAAASHSQAVVARVDRLHSAAVWVLALLGLARRFRYRRDLALVVLALAPIPVLVSNDYGGEMIFRVYLFGLPFAAFFAAAACYPRPESGHSWRTAIGALAVVLALVPGFVFGYYGKEQANYFSPGEVAAARFVYGIAPRGSLIVGATSDFPWAFQNFEFYDYLWFALLEPKDRQVVLDDPVAAFTDYLSPARHHHAYAILTRSQAADIDMSGVLPRGELTKITDALTASPRFLVIYRNADAMVITANLPFPKQAQG